MKTKTGIASLGVIFATASLAGCITINDSFNKTSDGAAVPPETSAPAVELDVPVSRTEIIVNGKSIPCPEMGSALEKFNQEALLPFQWTPRDGVYSPLDVVANFCLQREHKKQGHGAPPPKAPIGGIPAV